MHVRLPQALQTGQLDLAQASVQTLVQNSQISRLSVVKSILTGSPNLDKFENSGCWIGNYGALIYAAQNC